MGAEAYTIIKEIGRKLAVQTGEQLSCFLVQKISIELQRGNASSVLATLPFSRGSDEVFFILKNV